MREKRCNYKDTTILINNENNRANRDTFRLGGPTSCLIFPLFLVRIMLIVLSLSTEPRCMGARQTNHKKQKNYE